MKSKPTWKRIELGPGNPGIGDAAAQLFEGRNSMDLGIFIREDLQNRVDARKEQSIEPVNVKISFKTLPAKLIEKYFTEEFQDWYRRTKTQNLNPADAERRTKEINSLFASPEFPVLVIEDFETTGLNGPVNSKRPEKDTASPYYHPTNSLTCFLRVNGRSGKTGKQLGSAGFGRHVYYKASRLSTKFVFTVPTDLSRKEETQLVPLEPRPLFFGQALLPEFIEQNGSKEKSYCSYYYLTGRNDPDGLPMPLGIEVSDAELVEQARRDFGLSRQSDQHGCSVIIPFPLKNFNASGLINGIVENFAMPILSGALSVEVEKQRIAATNLATLADRKEVNAHNAFLAEALQAKADLRIRVEESRLAKPLDSDLFNEKQLVLLGTAYRDRELVAIEIEIAYGPRPDQLGVVKVCLRKPFEGQKGKHLVARSGLVLSDYSDSNYTRASNAMSLVQADKLGALLRSIENPAHTAWLPGDIDLYDCNCPTELIQFVKGAHSALDRLLTNLDSEEDFNIFKDLLPAGNRPGPGEIKPAPFEAELSNDVFRLKPAGQYDASAGAVWRLALVYDSFFGSARARKGYRPGSFSLQAAKAEIRGGEIKSRGACHLDVSVTDAKAFQLEIGSLGFADWADIRFHAELISPIKGVEP